MIDDESGESMEGSATDRTQRDRIGASRGIEAYPMAQIAYSEFQGGRYECFLLTEY